jgi:hypothetical protein
LSIFGSPPEIFHNKVSKIIKGIASATNATDDILIKGKTREESNHNVQEVLHRLSEDGLTANSSKCQFNQSQITFFV